MPAPTAALLSALVAVQFGAGAGISTQTRGGLIPTGGSIESDPSLDVTISPSLSLTLAQRDANFAVGYDLRLLRRFFVEAAQRFIILHSARAGYTDKFGRGWDFTADVSARYGEIDFANANLNTPQPGTMTTSTPGTAPAAVSVPVFTVELAAGLAGRLGRNHSLGFGVTAGHQRPLNITVENGQNGTVSGLTLFQRQTNGGLSSSYGYTVSANLGVNVSAGLGFVAFPTSPVAGQTGQTGQNFTSGNTSGGVTYRIGRSDTISGSLGVLLSEGTSGILVSPIGQLGWSKTWASNLQYRLQTNLSAGVSGTANALVGNVEPRANSRFTLEAGFGKDWTVRFDAFFGAPVPIGRSGQTNIVTIDMGQETVMGAELPVSYRISDALSASAGVAAQTSATRLDAMDFMFVSPSITGFVGLTARVGLAP